MAALKTIARTNQGLACASDGTIFRNPARPEPKRDVRRALRKFGALMKDKDDTALGFEVYDALPWKDFLRRAEAITLSNHGDALRAAEPLLAPILDDHDALRRLPRGSVAHAYCDFMEREGFSAAGLVAEGERLGRPRYGDLVEWYDDRLRDTHDLLHVLTGYGRDALGEGCMLLFTYGQQPTFGHLLMGYASALHILSQAKGKAPVLRAAREGHRLGKSCPPLAEVSIRALLAMDLAEARARFGIAEPKWYHRCHEIWRCEGVDPNALLAKKKELPLAA